MMAYFKTFYLCVVISVFAEIQCVFVNTFFAFEETIGQVLKQR